MTPKQLIEQALAKGRTALDEFQSKELLAAHGVPVAREMVAASPAQAAEMAAELGFPVALKALGHRLAHKSERGLVALNLGDAEAVARTGERLLQAAGTDAEGLLVAPMAAGRRELLAGLFVDRQFGPVVMLGLGGVYTEALSQACFALAPLSPAEAAAMLESFSAPKLLGEFRGEAAVDREALLATLIGLGRLAVEHPEVSEVDINPLLLGPDGRLTAVDALVVLNPRPALAESKPPADLAAVGALFYPKSVALVGASDTFSKWGQLIYSNVAAGGFAGDIYMVNPKGGTMAGRPVYKSIDELPTGVDAAVVTIPAAHVKPLVPAMAAKGIKGMVLISSGFSEVGEEGRLLEEELVACAREHGIVILGPNTMGICTPPHGFYCTGAHVRPPAGNTAFVSQSGNMGVQLLGFAKAQGIGIRAFGGSGNEAMFTIEDALAAFENDRHTDTVLLYLESVKDGRRFFETARRVSRKKPVVVLKGGRTRAGEKAAASHTGALASDQRVFQAACRGAGVVVAEKPMDLLDLSAAFSSLPLPKGNRVAIMTLGGGWGVVTSDLCNEAGLTLPPLDQSIIEQIDQWLPKFWSRANPVDLVGDTDPETFEKTLRLLAAWDQCDMVIHLGCTGRDGLLRPVIEDTLASDPNADEAGLKALLPLLREFENRFIGLAGELMEGCGKPIVGVSLTAGGDDKTVAEIPGRRYKAVSFATPERAVKALSEMVIYRRWLDRA